MDDDDRRHAQPVDDVDDFVAGRRFVVLQDRDVDLAEQGFERHNGWLPSTGAPVIPVSGNGGPSATQTTPASDPSAPRAPARPAVNLASPHGGAVWVLTMPKRTEREIRCGAA